MPLKFALKTIAAAALAGAVLMLATPASAQGWNGARRHAPDYGYGHAVPPPPSVAVPMRPNYGNPAYRDERYGYGPRHQRRWYGWRRPHHAPGWDRPRFYGGGW